MSLFATLDVTFGDTIDAPLDRNQVPFFGMMVSGITSAAMQ